MCDETPLVSTAQSSTPTRNVCPEWAARRSFAHALCSCGDVNLGRALVSTTVDSSQPERELKGSAAVGINGNYLQTDYVRIDGSLTIAGNQALSSSGGFDVAGDLRLAGPATAAGPLFVGRDAWLLGATSSLSLVEIKRDLHLGPDAAVTSFGPVLVSGRRVEEPFAIAPPCACAQSDWLDVPGMVADGLARNDNARIGLSLDALDAVSSPVELTLSCGRFAVRRIGGVLPITLRIEGEVVLFVDGNVELGPAFLLELAPGATLDWFVRGAISIAPSARLGDSARPGALRLYSIEPAELTLPGTEKVALNLYAPRANVSVGGLGDVYGAVFAASVETGATLILHYDRSVLNADAACASAAPASCNRCDDCAAGLACLQGTCGSCVSDTDCCFPLVCQQGGCTTLGND
jgi:hypothetical protein